MTLNELSEYVPLPKEEILGAIDGIRILKARFGGLRVNLTHDRFGSNFLEYSAKCYASDGSGKMMLEQVFEGETFVRIGVSKKYRQEYFVKQNGVWVNCKEKGVSDDSPELFFEEAYTPSTPEYKAFESLNNFVLTLPDFYKKI